jgi:5-methylcytosine-specific restriction protein A
MLKKFCNRQGCLNLTQDRYCEAHQSMNRAYDDQRESAAKRGYDSRWRKAREGYLKRHPLCACDDCKRLPVPLPATVVDHIKPHRGDKVLFWDRSNWQPMAKPCHDRKTAKEDGGFGR